MKKIIIAAIGIISFAGVATAADLETTLDTMGASMSLSSGTVGTYVSGTDDANYVISTKNAKGTKAYATSSTVTKIYYVACASQPCGSNTGADLISPTLTDDQSATDAVEGFGTVLGAGTGGNG